MSKTVFLFSGQGSQYKGMALDLIKNFSETKSIWEIGKNTIGIDLIKIVEQGNEDDFLNTSISQPLIFATSLTSLEVAKINNIHFDAVAGHSLGEYAAMVASEMISIEEGFRLISIRSNIMKKVSEENPGLMYAVMGKDEETIKTVCEQTKGYVEPVNYNSDSQIVIAGELEATESCVSKLNELGAKCIKLKVKSAFHSQLMKDAAVEFKEKIKNVEFKSPKVDFYSNLTGNILEENIDMKDYLSKHIMSPVKFTHELKQMQNDNITTFIELGPNKTLTSFVKKTLKNTVTANIEDPKSLEKTLSILQPENKEA